MCTPFPELKGWLRPYCFVLRHVDSLQCLYDACEEEGIMYIASPVTENRDWIHWIVAMASLFALQLIGVAAALNLWRLTPKGRQTRAKHRSPALTDEEKNEVQARLVTVILHGSKAEKSASAVTEIWREVPKQ